MGTSLFGDSDVTKSSTITWFVLATILVGFIGLAFHFWMKKKETQTEEEPADYRHTYALILILAAGVIAAIVARPYLIPKSFGEFGHYRGEALREAMQKKPLHVGQEICVKCHEEHQKLHDKDAHSSVACESCHGPGAEHSETKSKETIVVPEGKEVCIICHRQLIARPGDFPQVRWEEHYKRVGVKEKATKCIQCHSPHEPLFMDRDLREARLHPTIHRCRDCHKGAMRDEAPLPKQHPSIFECRYCHTEIADDFSKRSHAKLQCNSCHKFFKETEYAGRIIRDADPRFCLLCHKAAEFRSDDAPPGIEWPSHREDMSSGPEDDSKICINCHQEYIHLLKSEIKPDTADAGPPPDSPPSDEAPSTEDGKEASDVQ